MLQDRCPVCHVCLSVTLVYCGQTAGWIKMPLGTEVGLSTGYIVSDGEPAPLGVVSLKLTKLGKSMHFLNDCINMVFL